MCISYSAAGVNIPVREDCGVVEPAALFLVPLGKIPLKKSKMGVTFLGEKVIVSSGRIKIFEKSEKGV